MKKFFGWLLAAVFLVSMAACAPSISGKAAKYADVTCDVTASYQVRSENDTIYQVDVPYRLVYKYDREEWEGNVWYVYVVDNKDATYVVQQLNDRVRIMEENLKILLPERVNFIRQIEIDKFSVYEVNIESSVDRVYLEGAPDCEYSGLVNYHNAVLESESDDYVVSTRIGERDVFVTATNGKSTVTYSFPVDLLNKAFLAEEPLKIKPVSVEMTRSPAVVDPSVYGRELVAFHFDALDVEGKMELLPIIQKAIDLAQYSGNGDSFTMVSDNPDINGSVFVAP